jgi:deoxyadenosine/deoxycytidine kinase
VVFLRAPVDVLMGRIAKRGRAMESTLSVGYLERLSDAYNRFFYQFDDAPLLIVDASEINPVDNESDYRCLLAEICRRVPGRRYFNPQPLAIHWRDIPGR